MNYICIINKYIYKDGITILAEIRDRSHVCPVQFCQPRIDRIDDRDANDAMPITATGDH